MRCHIYFIIFKHNDRKKQNRDFFLKEVEKNVQSTFILARMNGYQFHVVHHQGNSAGISENIYQRWLWLIGTVSFWRSTLEGNFLPAIEGNEWHRKITHGFRISYKNAIHHFYALREKRYRRTYVRWYFKCSCFAVASLVGGNAKHSHGWKWNSMEKKVFTTTKMRKYLSKTTRTEREDGWIGLG